MMARYLPLPIMFFALFPLLLSGACDENRLPVGYCGNGVHNRGEECDEGLSNSNLAPDACREDCTLPTCGDGIKDSDEECDSYQLGQSTCSLLGFDRGTISCNDDCTIDTSLCSTCGNGIAELSEQCDNADLAGTLCTTLGFAGGTLSCGFDCTFDRTRCVDGCGNGVVEAGESCDGETLNGYTCEAAGFEGGTLRCAESCAYDFSACTGGCGNGVVEAGESCDDGNQLPGDGCHDCVAPAGTFSPYLELSFPYTPSALDVRDFDGDGIADLLVGTMDASMMGGSMALFLSSEGFEQRHNLASGAMVSVMGLAHDPAAPAGLIGVSVTADGSAVWHWFSHYSGEHHEILYTDRPRGMVPYDVDGVPGEEAVFTSWPTQSVAMFSMTTGLFTPLLGLGGNPGDLVFMDFDADQEPDILVVRAASQLVAMILSLGEALYVYHSARYVGGRPARIVAADFNVDGYEDAIITDASNPILYLIKGSSGGLTNSYYISLPEEPHLIATAHFNADQIPDLAISFPASGSIALYTASGEFEWSDAFVTSGCTIPIALKVADMNGDGLNDLIFACTGEKKAVVLVADPM